MEVKKFRHRLNMPHIRESLPKLFEFMLLLGKLKSTERAGWVKRGVNKPESIADHMYRMAMMSFLIEPSSTLCREKCIKMSLVHDLAESIVGDITPVDGISKEEKHQMEKDGMLHIQTLVNSEIGSELHSLWKEYEDQKTAEAKFVKDLDKFDMILQANEYETSQRNLQLQEFFDSTKGVFESEQVKQWVEHLYELRQHRIASCDGHSSKDDSNVKLSEGGHNSK